MGGTPRFFTFVLTTECNSRCPKCGFWRMKPRPDELSASKWIEIISKLHGWLGEYTIFLSGGEPTLKEGYLDILRHARSLGIKTSLTTNALNLDHETATTVAKAGPTGVSVSIDGPSAINDAMKGAPGATWRAWNAIESIKAADPSIVVSIAPVLMRANMHVVPQFVSTLLRDERVDWVHFQAVIQMAEQARERWYAHSPLWPDDPAATDRAIDWLIEQKNAGARIGNPVGQFEVMRRYFADPEGLSGIPCGVGRDNFTVFVDGSVTPCGQMGSIGNVATDDPVAIWSGEAAVTQREAIASCDRFCHQLVNCCYVEDAPA